MYNGIAALEQFSNFSNSEAVLLYDTTIPLVGIFPREMKAHISNIHNTQRCKQPKCPSTDELINKEWHIHTREYYSVIKKNEVLL